MSETTAVAGTADAGERRPPPEPPLRAACVKLAVGLALLVVLFVAAALRRRVLAPHRLRGLRRDHRRDRAEPARRHHRPAVAGPRLLPGGRRRHLHLRLRREPGGTAQPVRRSGLAAAARHGPGRRRSPVSPGCSSARSPPGCAGIYLGVASLGLVFIGHHVLNTWTLGDRRLQRSPGAVLLALRLQLRSNDSPPLTVLGVPFGQAERLWYLGLVLASAPACSPRNLIRCRPGRALQTLRDSEVAASVMGVNVQGLQGEGVPGLLDVRRAVRRPLRAVDRLRRPRLVRARRVRAVPRDDRAGRPRLGGGATLGATFVSALPLVFQQYAGSLPFIVAPGEPGIVRRPGGRASCTARRSSSSCSSSPAASPVSRAACGAPTVHRERRRSHPRCQITDPTTPSAQAGTVHAKETTDEENHEAGSGHAPCRRPWCWLRLGAAPRRYGTRRATSQDGGEDRSWHQRQHHHSSVP